MKGTIRSNDKTGKRAYGPQNERGCNKDSRKLYGGTAEITMLSEVPPLICDPKLTDEFVGYMKE